MCFVFSVYESFLVCRKKNFNNDKGDLLLHNVHNYLPPKINYNKQVKEVFKFLAKVCKYIFFLKSFIIDLSFYNLNIALEYIIFYSQETIASLIDHVFENRPNSITCIELKQFEDEDTPVHKVK